MAVEAPNNVLTNVEQALCDALPQLAAFREFLGVDTPEECTGIFLDEYGQPPVGERWTQEQLDICPRYVIVASAPQDAVRFKAFTIADGQAGYAVTGTLTLSFHRRVEESDENAEETTRASRLAQDRWMKNRAIPTLMQLVDYWADPDNDGGPFVREMGLDDGPYHNATEDREAMGHWQGADTSIDWGVGVES